MTNSTQPERFKPWNDACDSWLFNQATHLDQLLSEDEEIQENRDDEMRVADIALNGFISTMSIFGAIETGLFEALESSPAKLDSLAQQMNIDKTNLGRLLSTLPRLGFGELKSQEWGLKAPRTGVFLPHRPLNFEPLFLGRVILDSPGFSEICARMGRLGGPDNVGWMNWMGPPVRGRIRGNLNIF
ncbi:hypothetical protein BGS_0388 [Beggiatoa sp. SS]|nr:hypothetical protein BGS_0388 [Beggiatoa sp. SS]